LTVAVVAPTTSRAVEQPSTRMIGARRNLRRGADARDGNRRRARSRRCVAELTVGVVAPASNRAVGEQRASV
jgi:hypothetical protein